MMKDGGQAFPAGSDEYCGPGMTLRDWFAGQALASMTVAPDYSRGPCNHAMVERAYVIADQMLAARAPKSEGAKQGDRLTQEEIDDAISVEEGNKAAIADMGHGDL